MTVSHQHRRLREPWGRRAATAALVALALLATGAAVAEPAVDHDETPPTILVLPPTPFDQHGPLEVRARLVDPSGIAEAIVHARGDAPGDVYRSFPMLATDDDVWVASVPAWAGRGRSVGFYVEAVDLLGNGPRRSGSPEQPFLAESTAVAAATPAGSSTADGAGGAGLAFGPWLYVGLLALCALGLVPVGLRVAHRRVERDFWLDLLAPLAYEDGEKLLRALDEVCLTLQHHPYRGATRLDTTEVVEWLTRLREREPRRLRQAWLRRRKQRAETGRRRPSREQCGFEEELFWCQVLAPLVDLDETKAAPALQALTGCPLDHPVDGRTTYPVAELQRRLAWVRRHGASAILRHLDQIADSAPAAERGTDAPAIASAQAGFSAVELLTVLAITATIVSVGALSVAGFADPLGSSEQLVAGTLKQARARAMAATTAERVRPIDAHTLVVERATGCGSTTWVVEERMTVELPREVAITWTGWSVCFDSRGIADDSVRFSVRHDDGRSRLLEVLRGGTIRSVS